ncbi:MAG: hypothetical protein QOC65_475 [Sphingomonadales bacterium]|nr:hypothetical protein [Sphingomonadales bacterium]
MRLAAILCGIAGLAGCTTTQPVRMYSQHELGVVAHRCGLALGEVSQEEEEPRLLFLFAERAEEGAVRCVRRWSRRHSLHFVHIEAVVEPEQ